MRDAGSVCVSRFFLLFHARMRVFSANASYCSEHDVYVETCPAAMGGRFLMWLPASSLSATGTRVRRTLIFVPTSSPGDVVSSMNVNSYLFGKYVAPISMPFTMDSVFGVASRMCWPSVDHCVTLLCMRSVVEHCAIAAPFADVVMYDPAKFV